MAAVVSTEFGIFLTLVVLGGAGGGDQGGVNDRALFYRHSLILEVCLHRLKDLLAEIVLLQQLAEGEDRGFIRDSLA